MYVLVDAVCSLVDYYLKTKGINTTASGFVIEHFDLLDSNKAQYDCSYIFPINGPIKDDSGLIYSSIVVKAFSAEDGQRISIEGFPFDQDGEELDSLGILSFIRMKKFEIPSELIVRCDYLLGETLKDMAKADYEASNEIYKYISESKEEIVGICYDVTIVHNGYANNININANIFNGQIIFYRRGPAIQITNDRDFFKRECKI